MKRLINSTFSGVLALLVIVGCSDITQTNSGEESVEGLSHVEGSTVKSNYEDTDDNGYPDEGEIVTGTYKALYAYDSGGDWYFDLGDGRVQGTVGSVDELNQSTLSVCKYKVQYRGAFENDPFLDNGWIKNNIKCDGYDYDRAQTYNWLAVHETDHRYTGDPDHSLWGTWERIVYAIGGEGNIIRPENYVN